MCGDVSVLHDYRNLLIELYNANPVPVIKTGIVCAHTLIGKTCFHHRENLLSLQGIQVSYSHYREPVFKIGGSDPCTPSVLPCAGLQCMITGYLYNDISPVLHTMFYIFYAT